MKEQYEAIKKMIIERLELDIPIEDFTDEMPLFEDGLGLDSIEGLEIMVGLEDTFDVKIDNIDNIQEDFFNVINIYKMVERCKSTPAAC